ncbi:unnamed protein product, partial [Staurois parvus]
IKKLYKKKPKPSPPETTKHQQNLLLNPGPCIHYICSPRTLHLLYLVSPDTAFTISGLPGTCIHYIWSPRTLHSLYLVSQDPAFTISGLPGPCIHYIWSPPDPSFTISGL